MKALIAYVRPVFDVKTAEKCRTGGVGFSWNNWRPTMQGQTKSKTALALLDEMREMRHYEFWQRDFELAREIGITHLRCGPPLHRSGAPVSGPV